MKINNKMGEQAVLPQNNGPNDNQNEDEMEQDDINEEEEENDDEFGDMSPEEFNALNDKMDELNSALDNIEQKNEVIYSELLKLLQANREIREQMEHQQSTANAAKSSEK